MMTDQFIAELIAKFKPSTACSSYIPSSPKNILSKSSLALVGVGESIKDLNENEIVNTNIFRNDVKSIAQ